MSKSGKESKMKKVIFEGVSTALITPTTENGIDFDAYGRLIDWQIDQGVNGLVIAATTGEGSTLSDEEHKAAISFAAERINKRVPMIAGTGSNDTAYSIELTRYACEHGADGVHRRKRRGAESPLYLLPAVGGADVADKRARF